jgi:Rps23 Pro-64 3,4-dihydroxylase Tpa1-like proline 4-hydroxylase
MGTAPTPHDYLEVLHRLLWPEDWGGEWAEWDSAADYLEAIAAILTAAENQGHIIPTNKKETEA